jgi:hypothetical protein
MTVPLSRCSLCGLRYRLHASEMESLAMLE